LWWKWNIWSFSVVRYVHNYLNTSLFEVACLALFYVFSGLTNCLKIMACTHTPYTYSSNDISREVLCLVYQNPFEHFVALFSTNFDLHVGMWTTFNYRILNLNFLFTCPIFYLVNFHIILRSVYIFGLWTRAFPIEVASCMIK